MGLRRVAGHWAPAVFGALKRLIRKNVVCERDTSAYAPSGVGLPLSSPSTRRGEVQMDDYGSGESPEGSAADASIVGGFGSIIDGVVDVATSAGDAALNSAYAVGDAAAATYYSAAA